MKLKTSLFVFALCCAAALHAQEIVIPQARYKTGDKPEWKNNVLDDESWISLDTSREWDFQGIVDNEFGYGWYRMRVTIPSSMKKADVLKKALLVDLGSVDDSDETYFNGKRIGKTGTMPGDPEGYKGRSGTPRRYLASPFLVHWDGENVIAVRVFNGGGRGGIFGGPVRVRMATVADMTEIAFKEEDRHCSVSVSSPFKFKGSLTLRGLDLESGAVIDGGSTTEGSLQVPCDPGRPVQWTATFTEAKSGQEAVKSFIPKYILTPEAPKSPRYNGPLVFGVRPGSPIILRLAFSGQRPMTFAVEGLPDGATLDAREGVLGGRVTLPGDYPLTLVAKNAFGTTRQTIRLRVGDKIALTPPMGWNSWNCWGLSVSQEKVLSSARALLEKGLADYGYHYVNIDDAWEAEERNADGTIACNEKFPDIQGLGEWLHAHGLRLGIYSSPGDRTCGHYLGSLGHEKQDAETYNAWGVDYLKYDWCGYAREFAKSADKSVASYVRPYLKMEEFLREQPRDIFYSLCMYSKTAEVWKWGHAVDANSWRTTGDILDVWGSVCNIGFAQQAPLYPYSQPGHWNDPDMLVVGKLGWGETLRHTRLTVDEQYTHISLWCLLAANLLIGCDVAQMDEFTVALLCNNEVLAIDQDPLGRQARPVIVDGEIQVWSRPLADGATALGVFNLSPEVRKVDLVRYLSQLGLSGTLRDLWRQKDIAPGESLIAPHGVKLLKIK